MSVSHRLRDGDHIGHNALLLEAPEPFTEPAEADLYLIGDRHPAELPHRFVDRCEVALGKSDAAGVAEIRFTDEAGDGPARRGDGSDLLDGLGGVPRGLSPSVGTL